MVRPTSVRVTELREASFSFRLHSQPGDVNGDAAGRTDITDVIAVRNHQFTSVTDPPPTDYSVFHDANGFRNCAPVQRLRSISWT